MANLKEADFYYGAILSHLFSKGINPMLIEGGADRQIYEFTTNEGEFKLFAKYRSAPIDTKQADYQSWQFILSSNDIADLTSFLAEPKHLSVCLVCGNDPLKTSEIAFLHKEEIRRILDDGKGSMTISRKKGERAFRLSIGGGRENALQIKSNRPY